MQLKLHGRSRRLDILIGCLLTLGTLHTGWMQLCYVYATDASGLLNGWAMSDWLIDYSQGFVRRGLGGRLLQALVANSSATGVAATISVVCSLAFATVGTVMLYRFKQRGWCWWLLCSPLLCCLMPYVTRKDYLLFALLALSLWLLGRAGRRMLRTTAATALTVVGILLHEAYFFWGAPLTVLAIFGSRNTMHSPVAARSACRAAGNANLTVDTLCVVLLTAVFALCCLRSGDAATARGIVTHWQTLLPGADLNFDDNNNIGALTWPLRDTLRYHFHSNFQPGFPFWLLTVAAAYYMCTQFLRVFSPARFTQQDSTRLGATMALLFVTLLPMLTVLSCDMARVMQYGCLGALMTVTMLPSEQIDAALPQWLTQRISSLNQQITRLLPPSRGLLMLILLVTASSPAEFDPTEAWYNTLFFNIIYPPFDWLCILLTSQGA